MHLPAETEALQTNLHLDLAMPGSTLRSTQSSLKSTPAFEVLFAAYRAMNVREALKVNQPVEPVFRSKIHNLLPLYVQKLDVLDY